MTLIVDPDLIPQGAITTSTTAGFSGKSGDTITIAGTADLPALTAGDYFEIRDAPTAANNGLYQETGGSPTTSSITADKVDGVPPENDAGPDTIRFFGNTTTEKVIHYDTNARKVWLLRQGTVVAADGIDMQGIYSRFKIDWKDDNDLNKHPFPCFTIDADPAGKYLMGTDGTNSNGWAFEDTANNSRELIRNGGFSEQNGDGYLGASAAGTLERVYSGIGSIGPGFEDPATDNAYYVVGDDPTSLTARNNFVFPGPVNEVVKTFDLIVPPDAATGVAITGQNTVTRNDGGSFITDGFVVGGKFFIQDAEDVGNDGSWGPIVTLTATVITVAGTPLTNNAADTTMRIAFDNREAFGVFLRVRDGDPNGKTFAKDDLAGIGRSTVGNYVTKFGLSNATDLKISETDANIAANTPYTEIRTRYLAAAYNREVDSATPRNFGIVIDCGTYSQSNGAAATTSRWDSASLNLGAGEALADYASGTLIVHEGTNQGSYTISGTPVDNAGTLEVTLVGTPLTVAGSSESFTIQRATPLNPSLVEIYEKSQYDRRQAADVNSATGGVVAGDTSDELMFFEGDTLRFGNTAPENPEGGGAGVMVEGFDPNATNSLSVKDSGGTQRTFPFVAAGNLAFSQTLVDDGADNYKLYYEYTEQITNTGFGISGFSGATATLDSSTTDLTAELALGDYIKLDGFTAPELNGTYVCTGTPAGAGPWTVAVRKLDGQTLSNEAAGNSVSLDKNPFGTPDAIIVDDNAGADITGAITALLVAFTFDYDNNVQGGRTAGTDANVVLVAIGSDTAQYVAVTGQITQNTGITITALAPQERNYNNP